MFTYLKNVLKPKNFNLEMKPINHFFTAIYLTNLKSNVKRGKKEWGK